MKLNRRELVLTGATLLVVVGGASVWLGEPLLKKWDDAAAARTRLENEQREAEHIIEQRAEWEGRLNGLRERMPKHLENEQVTAGLLRTIKQTADANRINVSRLQPDEEKDLGDGLREVAIECTWDADLDGLVHFLFAVQVQGAILDIRQMTIQPMQGIAGRLRGNFTVYNAFSRVVSKPEATPAAGETAPPVP
ncbi:MAG TPA: GspMb/PilO family protein [Kiritimatiellia bacterium]|jgi:hypothetical protein